VSFRRPVIFNCQHSGAPCLCCATTDGNMTVLYYPSESYSSLASTSIGIWQRHNNNTACAPQLALPSSYSSQRVRSSLVAYILSTISRDLPLFTYSAAGRGKACTHGSGAATAQPVQIRILGDQNRLSSHRARDTASRSYACLPRTSGS
jgi:hypothetical protein